MTGQARQARGMTTTTPGTLYCSCKADSGPKRQGQGFLCSRAQGRCRDTSVWQGATGSRGAAGPYGFSSWMSEPRMLATSW